MAREKNNCKLLLYVFYSQLYWCHLCSSINNTVYLLFYFHLKYCPSFKVCKSMHHHTIQINQPTRCNNFSSLLLVIYVQLNMFRASSRPSLNQPDHDQQHYYHHAPKVKPEAATAVVELLTMGVRMPETCWAVHKRQVITWEVVASSWLIYLNCPFHWILYRKYICACTSVIWFARSQFWITGVVCLQTLHIVGTRPRLKRFTRLVCQLP